MLLPLLWISLSWALLLIVFCGWGLSVHRILGFTSPDADSAVTSFWTGMAFIVIFLQIWHLAFPVDMFSHLIILALGLLGFAWNLNHLVQSKLISRSNRWFGTIAGFFVLWLANRATGPISITDAGLYHLNTIRWMTTQPIVPGLANLHTRLGLNSSYFLLFAFLESGPWYARSHHVLNGMVILILALQTGFSISRILKHTETAEFRDLFRMFLGLPLIGQCLYHAADTSPDFAVFALELVVGTELCHLIFSKMEKHQLTFTAFRIITVCALGISFKLSFVAIGVVGIGIAIGKLIQGNSWKARMVALYLSPLWLQLSAWIIRGVILTGYVLFPLTILPLGVEWRVSQPQTSALSEWIRSWARTPYESPSQVLSNWNWFAPWVERLFSERLNLFEVVFPLAVSGIGLILLFRNRINEKTTSVRILLFLCPILSSLIYWFVAAPDPRFAGALFWLLGAGMLTIALQGRNLEVNPRILMLGAVVVSLLITRVYYAPLIVRPSGQNGLTPVPVASLTKFKTRSGLTLFVPVKSRLCWDSPLPCTPYPSPDLRLRRANEIRSGFLAP